MTRCLMITTFRVSERRRNLFIIPSVRKVNKVNFLDNENERPRLRLSDDQVWQEIIKLAGVTCSSDFQKLERQLQRETLGQLRELGASVRQLERLTAISREIIPFERT